MSLENAIVKLAESFERLAGSLDKNTAAAIQLAESRGLPEPETASTTKEPEKAVETTNEAGAKAKAEKAAKLKAKKEKAAKDKAAAEPELEVEEKAKTEYPGEDETKAAALSLRDASIDEYKKVRKGLKFDKVADIAPENRAMFIRRCEEKVSELAEGV